MKKRRFAFSFRKSRKTAKYRPGFQNQTMWHNEKVYAAALLLLIGMLAVPIYTNFAVKQKGPEIIYSDSSAPAPRLEDFCRDTDGRDYGAKGSVSARSQESVYSFEDSCAGSVLKEYYCNGNRMASELKKCANGCSDGMCVP